MQHIDEYQRAKDETRRRVILDLMAQDQEGEHRSDTLMAGLDAVGFRAALNTIEADIKFLIDAGCINERTAGGDEGTMWSIYKISSIGLDCSDGRVAIKGVAKRRPD